MKYCLNLSFVLVLVAAVQGDTAKPKEIEKLITQLGDQEFSVREEASRSLEKIGVPALDMLRKAEKSQDPEVARRARAAVDYIELHDPKLANVRKQKHIEFLVECLGGTNYQMRQQATRELQQLGKEALPALEKAANSSANPTTKALARNLAQVIKRTAK